MTDQLYDLRPVRPLADLPRAEAALRAAVAATPCPVGRFEVSTGADVLVLKWVCRKGHPEVAAMRPQDSSMPWDDWGGEAIIAASGLGDFDNAGGDTYLEFDEELVCDWVNWFFGEDA